jgi:TonB-dependent starch-binding outer membrane protein SusC
MEKRSTSQIWIQFMRFSFTQCLLMLVFLATSYAHSIRAQDYLSKRISVRMENTEIQEVLRHLEKMADIRFMYSSNVINIQRHISVNATNEPLGDVLDQMLKPMNIQYELIGKKILLKPVPALPQQPDIKIKSSIETGKQIREVSGTVTDEDGNGLPGVSVVVKGTTRGTTTNSSGNFELDISESAATLIFSFVGYVTQEVAIDNQSNINVQLKVDYKSLEEVVVVGYGTQKKSDLTGAVSSISESKIQSRPVTGFNDALQGRSSGVQVRQSGGDLSGKFSISIRGTGSVTGNNDPLIVVDGVPLFSTNFSTINPQDIASMDILKDASATAIYGARAANGVVIITTKQGKAGKATFTFNTDVGFEQISNRYDVMSTEEQRLLFVEGFKNTNRNLATYDDPSNPVWQTDTDWQDLGTRTGYRQNYNIGFSGGNDKNVYSGSVSYLNRKGILVNTDLQTWSLRLNLQSKVNDWITVTSNLSGSYQDQNFQNNDSWGSSGYRSLVFQHSYTKPYDEFGNLNATNTTAAPFFGANDNPLIELILPTRENSVTRLLGNIKFDFQLTKDLKLSANAGADLVNGADYIYLPVYKIGIFNRPEGITTENSSKEINWVSDAYLTYDKKVNDHSLNVVGGISLQQFYNKDHSITGRGTIDNVLNQLSNQTSFIANGSTVTPGLASGFLRVNYGFQGKYLMTATVRRDGSSRFGPENKFGTFPSASFAWRLSEEEFMKNSTFFNDAKFRVSYGLTGNQNIGNYAFITRAAAATYVSGNTVTIGNASQNIGNPNLKWETSKQFDIGLDLSILRGRINSTIDFYNKQSQDLLVSTPIALTSGVGINPILNIGSLKNTGVEFALSSHNIKKAQFSWDTDFNITYNVNKVIDVGSNSIGNPLEIPGESIPLSNQPTNLTRSGYPVGAFYMYEFAGIWQLGQEEAARKWSNAVPGDPRYTDLNGNGVFDEGDKMYVGNPNPKLFGGVDNTFNYGDFSLSVFLNYSAGNKLYNTARNLFSRSVPFVQNFAEVNDFWTPQNPSNTVPRPSQGGNTTTLATMVSTRFLENADFIRIKNLSLSYRVPSRILNGVALQGAQITVSGTNLFTFTRYTGLDPEASSRASLLSSGIDYTPYPLTRLFSLSLRANF